jgi:hypothetical protein
MTNLIGLLNILLGKCAKLHLQRHPMRTYWLQKDYTDTLMEFVFGGWDMGDIVGVLQQGYIGVVSFSSQD